MNLTDQGVKNITEALFVDLSNTRDDAGAWVAVAVSC